MEPFSWVILAILAICVGPFLGVLVLAFGLALLAGLAAIVISSCMWISGLVAKVPSWRRKKEMDKCHS